MTESDPLAALNEKVDELRESKPLFKDGELERMQADFEQLEVNLKDALAMAEEAQDWRDVRDALIRTLRAVTE